MKTTITLPTIGKNSANDAGSLQTIKRVAKWLTSADAALWWTAGATAVIYAALLLDDTKLLAMATLAATAGMLRCIIPMTKEGGEI